MNEDEALNALILKFQGDPTCLEIIEQFRLAETNEEKMQHLAALDYAQHTRVIAEPAKSFIALAASQAVH